MAQTILYYPKIDIQDSAWLRNAILYWDKVSSIVPYGYYVDLSPELQYLQDLGVYDPIYPNTLFNSEFAQDFADSVFRRFSHYKKSSANYSENLRIHRNKIYAPAIYEWIHYGKIPGNLSKFFEEKQLIRVY